MSQQSKLSQLLEECKKNTDNCFALNIGVEHAILMGPIPKSASPISALVLQKEEGSVFVKGLLDSIYLESSSGNITPEKIVIGVDCRKNDNVKVYYNFGSNEKKITSKTKMSPDDMFLIYWEIEQLGCLTFCSYDGARNEVIREVLTANDEPMKRLLRGIVSQFMSLLHSTSQPTTHPDPLEKELTSYE